MRYDEDDLIERPDGLEPFAPLDPLPPEGEAPRRRRWIGKRYVAAGIVAQPVRLSELPKHVPQAFIAIEDRRYYSHWGVDPIGIARAAWRNLLAGGVREGGSTITQQLAKGVFLSNDRSFGRKGREM